jgi:hypothetical protein
LAAIRKNEDAKVLRTATTTSTRKRRSARKVIDARGDKPNMHDILTGSQPDGRAFSEENDKTCRNWTSSGEGGAMRGHHDRQGLRDDESSRSWNSSHPSRGLQPGRPAQRGGNGLFYCFAAN